MVIVDAGDLFFEQENIKESLQGSARLKAELIAQAYNRIGCDALNIGEMDFALGLDFLKHLEKIARFPFVSANLTDTNNQPLFKRYIIKNVNGIRVGIFGLVSDRSDVTSNIKKATRGALIVQDELISAENVMKELSGKADIVIALTHNGVGRDWVIARRIKGINVIIGGHDKQKLAEPHNADGTLIAQAGDRGQHVGHLQVLFNPDGSKTYKNEIAALGKHYADDVAVGALVKDYRGKVTQLYGADKQKEPAAKEPKSAECSACHGKIYDSWMETKHAIAYASLVKKERQYDPECLACHTTNFEQPGGFTMKSQALEMVNIQCYSCHGSAVDHLTNNGSVEIKKPGRKQCVVCHTEARSPGYVKDYEKYLSKVKHVK
jgi:hypothetical protein